MSIEFKQHLEDAMTELKAESLPVLLRRIATFNVGGSDRDLPRRASAIVHEAADEIERLTRAISDVKSELADTNVLWRREAEYAGQQTARLTAAVAVLDAITTPDGDLRLPTNEAEMARLQAAFVAAKETP